MGMIDWRTFLKRRGAGWRIRHFIDELEAATDEMPPDYEEKRNAFNRQFHAYNSAKTAHTIFSAIFYASVITSVTASVGFQINIFERIYGTLGFSTVFILYLLSRYQLKMQRISLENHRARMISYLTTTSMRSS